MPARWEMGGYGGGSGSGSGVADRPDAGETNGPDISYNDTDDDGVADDPDPSDDEPAAGPDSRESDDGGSSGIGDGGASSGVTVAGTLGGIPFREGGPSDPDVGTSFEDDDLAPSGSSSNPTDPIDNPSRYGYSSTLAYLAEHYPNSDALATVAASLGRDPTSFAPTDGDDGPDVNAGGGGGGVESGDEGVVVTNPDGTTGPESTDPDPNDGGSGGTDQAREQATEQADRAQSWLTDNQETLTAVSAAVTVGSVAVSLWGDG